MAETTDIDRETRPEGAGLTAPEVDIWFARNVLPLEAVLMQFLRRNWSDKSEIADLRQDVYVRVYEAALKKLPELAKPFVFATARNLLINRVRQKHVVPIEAVADLDTLGVANDEPPPDRSVMARDELRRLQIAIDRLPTRCREAVIMGRINGLSGHEIAQRMGISEPAVSQYIDNGLRALADMLYGEAIEVRREK
jgi:RNA polymerase sigma-70 factor (ECF subfamily)